MARPGGLLVHAGPATIPCDSWSGASEKTANEICRSLGIGRRTFFYHLAKKQPGPEHSINVATANHAR